MLSTLETLDNNISNLQPLVLVQSIDYDLTVVISRMSSNSPVASNGAVRMELETAVNNKDEPITCIVCKETYNSGVPDNCTVRRPVPTPCGCVMCTQCGSILLRALKSMTECSGQREKVSCPVCLKLLRPRRASFPTSKFAIPFLFSTRKGHCSFDDPDINGCK